MSWVIALASPKGGVGRSSTAVHLAGCLAAHGRRVLVVDLDPQQSATRALGLAPAGAEAGAALVDDGAPLVLRATSTERLVVASLGGAMLDLEPALERREDRAERLRRALQQGEAESCDIALVDPPPGLGRGLDLSLVAAEAALLLARCEPFASEGLTLALEQVRRVKKRWNPALRVLGVALTGYDHDQPSCRAGADAVRAAFGERVLDAVLPWDPEVPEAAARGLPILAASPLSRAAWAFTELAKEVLHHERNERAG